MSAFERAPESGPSTSASLNDTYALYMIKGCNKGYNVMGNKNGAGDGDRTRDQRLGKP